MDGWIKFIMLNTSPRSTYICSDIQDRFF